MPDRITITVDGMALVVSPNTTVAVAVMIAGRTCRASVGGEPRGPLCGMGTCFECRVAINGTPHCRSCQVFCQEGMEVRTGD